MDIADLPLKLVAPLALGESLTIAPGVCAELEEVSSELGLQLRFRLPTASAIVEIEPRSERPTAARGEHFQFAYRTGDKDRPLDAALGRALCLAVVEAARPNEARVMAQLTEAAERARAADPGARIREVEVEQLLQTWGSLSERYYTLSPYVGCLIGCRFCYAQSRLKVLRQLQGLPEAPWGSWVDARVNAPEVLKRELAASKHWPVKFCPIVSDPYHAIERKLRLTRRCLEVLRDHGAGRSVILLTRSAMIAEDAELLAELPSAFAGVSLPTADDDVRRAFEPRGASIPERLTALRQLRERGVNTFAIVQPLLPGSIDQLAEALASAVRSVRIDVLRGVEGATEEFSDPRFEAAASDAWQAARAAELAERLTALGVELWERELPPGVHYAQVR